MSARPGGDTIRRASDDASWAAIAVEQFVRAMKDALSNRDAFHVVVPGGSTPKLAFGHLIEPETLFRYSIDPTDWQRVHLYFGDERCVPPDDSDSNYRMIREALLDCVPIPADRVHRIHGELDAEESARLYNDELRQLLGNESVSDRGRFDLVILGMGPDGHAASLIPGVDLHYTAEPWVGVGPAPMSPAQVVRVTLTPCALRRARETVFWVRGSNKSEVVRSGIERLEEPRTIVPEIIGGGAVTWILDEAAATLL